MKCLIEVYGCQMNVHDSEILSGILLHAGHEITHEISEAEAVLVVTCAVREHAETRALGRLTHLAGLCASRRPVMVLCGCVAQEHGSNLLGRIRVLDLVVGPDEYHRLPEFLRKGAGRALTTQGEEEYEGFTPVRTEFPRAFVNIIRGCDNYCTYCIVPYVRGRERSRSPELITAEVAQLVEEGYGEITLLGQNVNSYTFEKTRFPQLLAQVSDIAGDRCRIRFVTSHPRDLSEELAMVMASRKNICKSFHLPVQSGSDRVLKAMNRGYTRKGYLEKVAMLRDLMPDIVLSTDMIAGFPGETPEDFQKSVSLLDEVEYDYAFLFRYSERKGTEAAEMSPSVPVEERLRRLYVLQELQGRVTMEKSKALVGREMPVLVTGAARRPGQLASRTGGNRMVILENCEYQPGETVQVRITAADGYTHFGEPV